MSSSNLSQLPPPVQAAVRHLLDTLVQACPMTAAAAVVGDASAREPQPDLREGTCDKRQ